MNEHFDHKILYLPQTYNFFPHIFLHIKATSFNAVLNYLQNAVQQSFEGQ